MEYPAAVLEVQKSDALVHNLHLFTPHLTAVSCLPVAVGTTLNANSIPLGSRGRGSVLGQALLPGCAPQLAFPGQERLQGPLGHLGQQGSSGSGIWGPLHPAQQDLVLFILRGMWDREHLEATRQPLK